MFMCRLFQTILRRKTSTCTVGRPGVATMTCGGPPG